MKSSLTNQGAIVTGGARGIGLGIAQRLASEGCRVALWDLSFDPFDAAAAGFAPASMQTVNVADYKQVEQAFAATETALAHWQWPAISGRRAHQDSTLGHLRMCN